MGFDVQLSFSNVSFTYVGAFFWVKDVQNCNFVLMDFSCDESMCPPSLLIDFSLKFILLDIRIVVSVCFLGLFVWIFFPPIFYSEVMSVFEVEVCFLCTAEEWILFSYLFCQPVSFL